MVSDVTFSLTAAADCTIFPAMHDIVQNRNLPLNSNVFIGKAWTVTCTEPVLHVWADGFGGNRFSATKPRPRPHEQQHVCVGLNASQLAGATWSRGQPESVPGFFIFGGRRHMAILPGCRVDAKNDPLHTVQ